VARPGSELFELRATCATRAAGEGLISPETEIAFPHEPHILFFVTPLHSSITAEVMQGSMQQLDYNIIGQQNIFHD